MEVKSPGNRSGRKISEYFKVRYSPSCNRVEVFDWGWLAVPLATLNNDDLSIDLTFCWASFNTAAEQL